jgi:putative DNA primase/helicase
MSWLDALSESRPGPRPGPGGTGDGVPAGGSRHEGRAGDDFNERADWADILLPLGAVLHHETDDERYWTRPGKDPLTGHSATTGYADDADRLKVFTPHWPPFADGEVYTKFGAYALLNHDGDYQAAARELSRLGYGSQQPTQAPPAGSALNEPPEMGPHPADHPQTDDSSTLAPVVKIGGRQRPEPLTELGFARRLVDKHGDELRYVVPWNRWLVWDGARWAPDTDGHVQRCMKVIAREVHTALIRVNAAPEVIRAARRAESSSAIKGALTLAATEPEIAITPDQLDAHPYLLNCRNGVVDLRTGELLSHDPALLLTKMAGAAYEPDAEGAEFTKFLKRIQPSEEMRLFIRRLLGLSLEGTVTAHILPIFYGDGANGKSTLTDAVMTALGDYADAADPDLLRARTFDAHPTGVADLFGLRLSVLHESDAGHRLAEGTVKRLTGGDRLKARRMREDFWSFDPSHTFVMLTNHKPVVSGTDEGIWRRLRLVPFEVIIPGPERDEDLGGKLADEVDAILAWLVAGHLDWRKNGLAEPGKVTEATQAYRAESDPLGRFIGERCLRMPALRTGSTELFKEFEKWCAAEREDPSTPTAFGNAMKAKGFESHKSSGRMQWHGIGLAADDSGEGGEGLCQCSRARIAQTWKRSLPSPDLCANPAPDREGRESRESLQLCLHVRGSRAREPSLPSPGSPRSPKASRL